MDLDKKLANNERLQTDLGRIAGCQNLVSQRPRDRPSAAKPVKDLL